MPNVKFITPSPYSQQTAELERRQKMAELLQQQAMEPMQQQVAGGKVIPISPLTGLTRVLQSYVAQKQLKDLGYERAKLEQSDIDASRKMAEEFGRRSVDQPIAQDDNTLRELGVRPIASSIPGKEYRTELVEPALTQAERQQQILPSALGAGVGPYQQKLAQMLYEQKPEAPKGTFAPINLKDVDVSQSDIERYRMTGNPAYLMMRLPSSDTKVGVPSVGNFTPESLEKYKRTGILTDLVPIEKTDTSKSSQGAIFALPDGKIVQSIFQDGKYLYETESGLKPVPPGARPTTAGVAAPLTQPQFIKYRQEIEQDKNALKQLDDYFATIKDMNLGYKRFADQVSANSKKFFGTPLNSQELNTQLAKGQVQGLVGLFRTEIVGPGVVTEADAQRIMNALGGDPSKLQDPAVAESLLRNLYNTKKANVEFLERELNRSNPYYGLPTVAAPIPKFNSRNMVVAPDGKTYTFPTNEQAAAFRKAIGEQ